LDAASLFQHGPHGSEELSPDGMRSIDTVVTSFGDVIFKYPIVVEGYSNAPTPADATLWSYTRAQLVRLYLEARYPFAAKNVGVMDLSGTPPPGMEHDHWSGVCIMIAERK
jgi:phospholipid/cholesterol/gamma-HCH transport system substrate-binding protein